MTKRRGSSPSQRQLRVGEELRHALARLLGRGVLRDPGLQSVSITVTQVEISPDLKNATAYIMPLGGVDIDKVVDALKRAVPFLRREVAREVRLKFAPDLRFEVDGSFEQADRVDSLLRQHAVAHPRDEDHDGA